MSLPAYRFCLPLLLVLPPAAFADTAPAATAAPDVATVAEATRRAFDVPGIAVAIIKDGQVVLAQGFGAREAGKAAPVTADTRFAIASLTKAYTSAALSILADEGKLSLDDRVVDHLPWFQMSDPYVTREMRLRDLLTHRSGLALGAGDLLFWPTTTHDTREIVRRLRHVPLETSFRADYAYDNVLYAVAQLVIEDASGLSYGEFLHQRIFQPLGMADTVVNADHLPAGADVATGHAKFDFTDLRPVPPMTWSNNQAAGGIYSSVNDLAKWMRVQLDGGVIGADADGTERRLFSADRHRAMWEVVTPIRVPAQPAVPALAPALPQFAGYGEGWSITEYRGQKLVSHTGGWPGMVSRLTLVPGLDLGVVVLTNQEVGAAFNTVTMEVLDHYLQAPDTDWVAAYAEAVAKSRNAADEKWEGHQRARDRDSKPSLPLSRYAATYRDPWYGEVVIALEANRLVMRFAHTAQLVGELEHWQHDTFIVRWKDRALNADAFATFDLTPDATVRELRMEAVSSLTDFSFDFHHLRLAPVR
ncbi:serine hydrolase [Arenimonas sp.]|uniref:serine hydrolase n=1 Tax=Arenimonas sp. TaxID=1872635 RepID=UPI002E330A86|nr:serine hydrolase [Arenimonas sp.]HEX4854233.1 serine hydrolase [Arenimonas sp.]